MPNGWSRPDANTSLLLGLAAPSAARMTRIRPGSDSAIKMSPFGATRIVRGSWRLDANSLTWNPGGTCGVAAIGLPITRGGFEAGRVAYGVGLLAGDAPRRVPASTSLTMRRLGPGHMPSALATRLRRSSSRRREVAL